MRLCAADDSQTTINQHPAAAGRASCEGGGAHRCRAATSGGNTALFERGPREPSVTPKNYSRQVWHPPRGPRALFGSKTARSVFLYSDFRTLRFEECARSSSRQDSTLLAVLGVGAEGLVPKTAFLLRSSGPLWRLAKLTELPSSSL